MSLKDIMNSYPVQAVEYAVANRIAEESAFAWWVPHTLKKRERILAKVKSKYWVRTHKVGIRIPKSVEEAKRFDRENGNTLWWDGTQGYYVSWQGSKRTTTTLFPALIYR